MKNIAWQPILQFTYKGFKFNLVLEESKRRKNIKLIVSYVISSFLIGISKLLRGGLRKSFR